MRGQVGVVLVNYRGWRDTVECIDSLRAAQYQPGLEIIVVDNASGDDSCERLRELYPTAHVIEMERNLGFAGGCNAGMRVARSLGNEFVWLLNNDTTVDPQAPSKLVALARAHPDATFYGSLICFAEKPDVLWFGVGKFDRKVGAAKNVGYNRPVSEFAGPPDAEPSDWISGCSILIRCSALDEIGFMDEEFFLYKEELEWQIRQPTGAWIVRRPLVRHKVGRSTGTSDGSMGRVFMSRNFIKLALRHAGVYLPVWLCRWSLEFVLGPMLKGHFRHAWAGLAGLTAQRTPGTSIVERWRGAR
jgi:GT2 family glycosyltransferase